MSEQGAHHIHVEVAFALPNKQIIESLAVPEGTTVREAVLQSGIDEKFHDVDLQLSEAKLGVFGKAVSKPEAQAVEDGDRIEIYRPLIADPKEVRKKRAAKVKAEKQAKSTKADKA